MGRCSDVIDWLIEDSGLPEREILGIGVAVGGLINRKTGIVEVAPKFGWEDVDVVAELANRTNIPLVCDYVVRVMTLGEKWYGRGAQYSDFICVSLGHGIGAGIVIDGELFYGHKGMCGELGHIVIDKGSDVRCKCGNRGCLSALASGYGIAQSARRALADGRESPALLALCENDAAGITAEIVVEAARKGDPLACEIFAQSVEYIGMGLATMINLFNPQAIFVGGGVAQAGELLFKPMRKAVLEHAVPRLAQKVEILPVTHGLNTPTMGAIALILREVLRLNIGVRRTAPAETAPTS